MLPPNYDVHSYATHIRDTARVKAYIAALERAIFPGAIVIDLGAGTGFFSLLACQLGAGHVYAIEPNPLVTLLEKQAAINGCADRITVLRKMSTEVELPQRADILIADLRGGMFPLFQMGITSLYDARQRLMKEDGLIFPQKDTVYLAVVENEKLYRNSVLTPWVEGNYGVDMSLTLPYARNTLFRRVPHPEKVLLPGKLWAEVHYGQQANPSIKSTVTWTVERPGTAHFLATWFSAQIMEGITYSTSPETPAEQRPNTYDGTFFPLEQPIELVPGDTVEVTLNASHTALKRDYTFVWETKAFAANGQQKAHYRQSDFFLEQFKLLLPKDESSN